MWMFRPLVGVFLADDDYDDLETAGHVGHC